MKDEFPLFLVRQVGYSAPSSYAGPVAFAYSSRFFLFGDNDAGISGFDESSAEKAPDDTILQILNSDGTILAQSQPIVLRSV